MRTSVTGFSFSRNEMIIAAGLASASFCLHIITNAFGYGFFRDELYYIACSDHLAWGYVDQPPLSLFVLKLSRLLLGDSLVALRVVPALAIAGTLWLTGKLTKGLGGNTWAVFLACLAVFISPIHMVMGSFYSMNALDIFWWTLAIYLVLLIIRTEHVSLWLWLGVVLGLGLMNKISVLFLGAGIAAGMVAQHPKWLTTRWPYIAGALAFALFLPYVFWNLQNDLAHIEFIQNASAEKYAGRSRTDFLVEQLLFLHPLNAPLAIAGLFALFFYNPLKPYRWLGWIYLTAFAILVINRTSKGEYLAPAYSILFAAAGVFFEQKLITPSVRWARYVYPVIMLATSIVMLPFALPVLPVESFIQYAQRLGITPQSSEKKELSVLPQFYADMFGWEEKARDVARVFQTLSKEDQSKCAIFASNYGRCGAIDFFGPAYGLPKSIGNHNNYWIWGPRDYTGEVMIILGGDLEDHESDFASCTLVGKSNCSYCMPYESEVNIFLCRNAKRSPQAAWQDEKHFQ